MKSTGRSPRAQWQRVPLGSVCKTFSGGTPLKSRKEFFGGDIPWIKSGDLNEGNVWSTQDSLTKAGLENSAATLVEPGTNLIALYGATAGVVGRSCIRAAINQAVLAVVPKTLELDADFLQYVLRLSSGELLRLVQGAQPNLNAGMVQALLVDLPSLPEQRKIADIISSWDSAIENSQALIGSKRRLFSTLRQTLLRGQRRLPKYAKSKWKQTSFDEILRHVFRPIDWQPDSLFRLVSIRRRSGGLFRRGDLLGIEYKTRDLHEVRAGDFLVSKRQVSHGSWGVVTNEFDQTHVSKEYCIFENKNLQALHMPFLGWLSQLPKMWHLAFLASDGVHREKLIFEPKDFLRFRIELPPTLEEQRDIVERLDAFSEEIRLLEAKLNTFRTQSIGLTQQLLSGSIPVKV